MTANLYQKNALLDFFHLVLIISILASIGTVCLPTEALCKESVLNSPHNLSATGSGGEHGVVFPSETRVCVFCHVPHHAGGSEQLWSRELPRIAYTPYISSTLKADPKPDLPTGASRLCLSCHDGTIALGQYVGSRVTVSDTIPTDPDPRRNPNLGTDLSDDHPISFIYDQALAAQSQLVLPSNLPPAIRLDPDGTLQCTACHDPHNNEFGNFLVIDNTLPGSQLCTACHDNTGWSTGAHNPQQTSQLEAGCINCHYAHSAPQPERLLHYANEEDNCTLNCHNGMDTSSADINAAMSALHRHPVMLTHGVHDPEETLPASSYHVECVDCHNPHQADSSQIPLSFPPDINGPLKGVRIDNSGLNATREYEVCFKCHAGPNASNFSGISEVPPNRVLQDSDQQNRFDQNNPSYHPVTTIRRGNGESLLVPLQAVMTRIYCSDCHNSDQSTRGGGSGANGPHGSNYEHILIARYDMPLPTGTPAYQMALYELCYRCHDETYIMDNGSDFANRGRNLHNDHVRQRDIPCYACHDPHGTSWLVGATPTNNAHLINFNRDFAASAAVPLPQYTTLVPGAGSCTVSCHHNATYTRDYSP